MTVKLSDLQRQAREHADGARSEGVKLSQYLRARGIAIRPVYDALVAARRKGVLSSTGSAVVANRASSPFVNVRMSAPMPARSPMVCRVLIGGQAVIECAEWPPADWLRALSLERTDAAA